ncbi:MAG: ImmA/IrrE family metallo-endopeptidase [Thermosynechococcaceae cyanobacterium]
MKNTAIKPIRSEADYDAALAQIDSLMDAAAGTDDADDLEVLATLVEIYEKQHFPVDMPDPIEAIKFRMDQENLTARDLVPLIGSRAKVSEVLSGKRTLTLKMIRALHEHLEIPADVLLQQSGAALPETPEQLDWSKFPLSKMAKLGWIPKTDNLKDRAEEVMCDLIKQAGGFIALPQVLYRKNDGVRQNAKMDPYALKAWCFQLLAIARQTPLPKPYKEGVITKKFARGLVQQSWSKDGPRLAKEYLGNAGIHLIYLPHLPRTYLDGAAIKLSDGTPVIGLTLRYDRLDNFWFCLCHELAHVALHMKDSTEEVFIDDLSLSDMHIEDADNKETDADHWAQEALIPSDAWNKSRILDDPTPSSVVEFAHDLGVNPAIIAGRIRKELNNYRLLTHYVGSNEVRINIE